MLKMIGRLKTHYLRLHGQGKTITLLFATLLMAMGLQLTLHAGTSQFLFDMDGIKDPGSLAVKLEDTRAPVSQWIASQLSEDGQWLLVGYDGVSDPSPKLQEALLSELNRLLQAGSLYNAQVFADIELSEQTQALIAQNPKDGEALVRLNRWLLADAYPYELASLSGQQDSEDFKGIAACRENLRLIKLARDNYRAANADTDPQWLSELSPEYLDSKVLLCPADETIGVPGVLTEGAADPTLPCSYLYEMRPSKKADQEILWMQEGDMTPIIRCEHHRLNLSVSGKIYRNGPERTIYNSNNTEFSALSDFLRDLRSQHGENFLKTQAVREKIKTATETLVLKHVPKVLNRMEVGILEQVKPELEAQLGKGILETQMGMDILQQVTGQVRDQVKEQLQSQLQSRLGEEFLKTEEGQDILKQLAALFPEESVPLGNTKIKVDFRKK
ncbi:hypothetical protein F4009_19205 [Candidatus Poribacteria bacterium]|nr:hypothetical protein [Candidatus Poribacteria bacterium]MYH79633.1 hypothetical protein [Candidatus Poribacteria bacterium]MYK96094.1 hypothetical protein [Candidatus Poribacteria bacterium]